MSGCDGSYLLPCIHICPLSQGLVFAVCCAWGPSPAPRLTLSHPQISSSMLPRCSIHRRAFPPTSYSIRVHPASAVPRSTVCDELGGWPVPCLSCHHPVRSLGMGPAALSTVESRWLAGHLSSEQTDWMRGGGRATYTCRGGESACELGPEGQMASQQEELVERSTAPGGRGRKALHSRSWYRSTWWEPLTCLMQGSSVSASTWAGSFFLWGCPWNVGCSAPSLATVHWMPEAPSPSQCDGWESSLV